MDPLIQYNCYPHKKGKLDTETHTQGEHQVRTGVLQPQAKALPAAGREAWHRLPWWLQREHNSANTLILDFWSPEQ